MKTSLIFIIFCSVILSCDKNNTPIPQNNKKNDTIIGKVVSINNPCITNPCLPGTNLAIAANSLNYYISIDGHLQDELLIINGDTIMAEDSVNAVGIINNELDIYGTTYYELEIKSLNSLNPTD